MPDQPQVQCRACPLRSLALFIPHSAAELQLISGLKLREVRLGPGETLIHEGETAAPLHTLLRGWAYRFRTLADGRRQILNFLLAGDLVGMQRSLGDAYLPGVATITAATFCVFHKDALWELHRHQPAMGFNLTWLIAHEESLIEDNLLSVGRRSATERVARLLVVLHRRAAALQRGQSPSDGGVEFPLTQQHIADALGLSLVHTNKTLRKLERVGLYSIKGGRLYLHDVPSMLEISEVDGDGSLAQRPLV